jgi:hypothetical protein
VICLISAIKTGKLYGAMLRSSQISSDVLSRFFSFLCYHASVEFLAMLNGRQLNATIHRDLPRTTRHYLMSNRK